MRSATAPGHVSWASSRHSRIAPTAEVPPGRSDFLSYAPMWGKRKAFL